jgi:serine/threonine-protein kinase
MIAAHLLEPPPRPSELRPGRVPAALDEVIGKGMAKKPEERYRSAGEMANSALDALTAPEQHQAVRILQHGEDAAAAETMARPVVPGVGAQRWAPPPVADGGSWPSQPEIRSSVAAGPPAFSRPAGAQQPDFKAAAEPRRNRKLWFLVGAAVVLLVAALGYLVRPDHSATPVCGQTALPFTGIDFRLSPGGVAVDTAGNVYVSSEGMYGRVVELAAGSNTTTVWPFAGLYEPQGLAVDGAGTVYVADFNNRVVKLAAGSNDQTVLPFTGLNYPEGVAVDSAGNVYVADRGNDRVVELTAGSNNQTVLPFDGLNDPDGVAVDSAGNVFVTDTDNNRVLKLPAGSNTQTVLPFTGLNDPDGVAVDSAGNVFVTDTDNNRVLKLPAGSNTQTVLPFTGVSVPWGVGVDNAGDVFVTEHDNNRVVKLAAGSNAPTEVPLTGLNTPLGVVVDAARNVLVADRGNDRIVKFVVAGCPG